MESKNLTPMLKQYFQIKKEHPNTILFFRMGDFYEMFFDDAKTAAPILEVVLTSRDKNKKDAVPMCGIPHHAKDNYVSKLLKKGFKVAICDQVEDPATAKGLVKREVTHTLTPATAIELDLSDGELNNYILSVFWDDKAIGIASIDLATSDFEVRSYDISNQQAFLNEFFRKSPREVTIPERDLTEFEGLIKQFPENSNILVNTLPDFDFNLIENESRLLQQFQLESVEGLGLSGYDAAIISAGVLLKHLEGIRRSTLKHLTRLHFLPEENFLILDSVSMRNLEIMKNSRTGNNQGTLFNSVDFTLTPMGKRLLGHWLSYPLINVNEIEHRLDGIEELSGNLISRTETRKILKHFGDLAKLNSRISLDIALPTHLLALSETLKQIPDVLTELGPLKSAIHKDIRTHLDPLDEVVRLIDSHIADSPSNNLNEGNYIRSGIKKELDELRAISKNAKEIVSAMERTEREKIGIPSLKIKYNRVFGYFIEVTKTHLSLVPEQYIRKQTLVNSERYITEELKNLEEKILRAEEKIVQLEKEIFHKLIQEIKLFSARLNQNSEKIALLDVISAGAELARKRNYCRPTVNNGKSLEITDGRHPVVELSTSKSFIPNDLSISSDSDQVLIITGPNMGGKSTYLRQNALIVILAQAGYFIPAEKAAIGICDRIFTRIGASDSLIEGKSTFLIEMIETSIILNNCSGKSLILLDEIGRGTSTFDGLSIAWAVIEHLHDRSEAAKTLFATHYHELTELSEVLDRVSNVHITVREWQDNVIFLHKIMPGATDQSFGIHVAKIAGIPADVIERAKEVLLNLEKKELNRLVKERITGRFNKIPAHDQQSLFPDDAELKIWDEIRNRLKEIEISTITPLEAMNILHYLKHKSDNLN